jgi:hypothetical protein
LFDKNVIALTRTDIDNLDVFVKTPIFGIARIAAMKVFDFAASRQGFKVPNASCKTSGNPAFSASSTNRKIAAPRAPWTVPP